jgi:lysozyme
VSVHGVLDRQALVSNLIRDEGIRLKPYLDTTNHITIGVGRNLTDKGISRDEALLLLDNDIDAALVELRVALPWFVALDEVRQRVLANMAFNLGLPKLLGFHNTLRAIANGDWPAAAAGMRASLWAQQVGKRAERLAAMMASGEERA